MLDQKLVQRRGQVTRSIPRSQTRVVLLQKADLTFQCLLDRLVAVDIFLTSVYDADYAELQGRVLIRISFARK